MLEKMWAIALQLRSGMANTMWIFALTLLFSLPLGLIVCFGRMTKFWPLRWLTTLYISVMRGTQLILQLLVVFFGRYYLFRLPLWPRFTAVIAAFSINYAAYFAEIYRGGIQSMPAGQSEAAKVLGYNRAQAFAKIILPQVIKRILPSITNEVITLVKDTSLAFSIAYIEMFTQAKMIAAAQTSMIPFAVAGIFYYIFNYLVMWVMDSIEKRLQYYSV